ncbi:MAG: hypothetical protein M1820_002405 [Bogoriella megaspora]|nr:MAG: hypothetical protein M1820_002405 [Bogoriella megaspora]
MSILAESLSSSFRISYLLAIFILVILIYNIARVVYQVYFSPLAAYPGPKLNAITHWPSTWHLVKGNRPHYHARLHEQYGAVVRVAPKSLSYITNSAWTDAYGIRKGHQEMGKANRSAGPLGEQIINSSRENHQRFRRLMSHAFSEKALREQIPLIQTYIDTLIEKLRATKGEPTNMVSWYNFTTFDLIGDLAFGEPFDCLKDSAYKPWVALIFARIKGGVFMFLLAQLKLRWLLPIWAPKKLEERKAHLEMTKGKVAQRLERGTERPDFMSFILRGEDEKSMTRREIEANSEILIIAGSETTATLLSGATYYLLRNPRVMKRLVDEVRSSFNHESEINLDGTNKLKYMLAVLNEALRVYPPLPGNMPRKVPEGGDTVGGRYVPAGTSVSVCQLAAFRSPENFRDPLSFVPERWLGDSALARVLWNFDLHLMPESQDWANQKIYGMWEKKPLYVRLAPVNRSGE